MHVDLCDADDPASLARLRAALASLGAMLVEQHGAACGVDLWRWSIGDEELTLFADSWSVDMEGSESMAARIRAAMAAAS